jgi:hypothetical protein
MIFFQEHNPHSITKAEGLATEQNITAQQNTVGHKKGFKETTYNYNTSQVLALVTHEIFTQNIIH